MLVDFRNSMKFHRIQECIFWYFPSQNTNTNFCYGVLLGSAPFLTIGSGRPNEMVPGFCVFCIVSTEMETHIIKHLNLHWSNQNHYLELDQSGPGKDLVWTKTCGRVWTARYQVGLPSWIRTAFLSWSAPGHSAAVPHVWRFQLLTKCGHQVGWKWTLGSVDCLWILSW